MNRVNYKIVILPAEVDIKNHIDGVVIYRNREDITSFFNSYEGVYRTIKEFMDDKTVLFHQGGMGQVELLTPQHLYAVHFDEKVLQVGDIVIPRGVALKVGSWATNKYVGKVTEVCGDRVKTTCINNVIYTHSDYVKVGYTTDVKLISESESLLFPFKKSDIVDFLGSNGRNARITLPEPIWDDSTEIDEDLNSSDTEGDY